MRFYLWFLHLQSDGCIDETLYFMYINIWNRLKSLQLPNFDVDHCKYRIPDRETRKLWTNLDTWTPRHFVKGIVQRWVAIGIKKLHKEHLVIAKTLALKTIYTLFKPLVEKIWLLRILWALVRTRVPFQDFFSRSLNIQVGFFRASLGFQ